MLGLKALIYGSCAGIVLCCLAFVIMGVLATIMIRYVAPLAKRELWRQRGFRGPRRPSNTPSWNGVRWDM